MDCVGLKDTRVMRGISSGMTGDSGEITATIAYLGNLVPSLPECGRSVSATAAPAFLQRIADHCAFLLVCISLHMKTGPLASIISLKPTSYVA